MVQFSKSSVRTDLTDQEVEKFYNCAGIVINELCKHVKNFDKMSNYNNLICTQNAKNAKNVKNNLVKLFQIYSNKIRTDNKKFNDAMAYVAANGDFAITIKCFIDNFETAYMLGWLNGIVKEQTL